MAELFLLLAAPCVGSFLGLLADRLPEGRPVAWARSACDHCGEPLGARDLVPVVSWALAGGRSRCCGRPLSPTHPGIEIAALAVAAWSLWAAPFEAAVLGSLLGWALLVLSLIDARHMILPDAITLPLVPAGLAATAWLAPDQVLDHAVGAALGFGALAGIGWTYAALRGRAGLGLGDAKLLAAAGAWVGWAGLPGIVLAAAVAALAATLLRAAVQGRASLGLPLPFGPFLAAATWLSWLHGAIWLA